MASAAPTRSASPKRRAGLRVLQVALVASLLLIIVVASVALIRTADTGTKSQTGQVPSEIERYSPIPGSVVRPQETVEVDLRNGLVGDLVIDGVVIPVDQTEQVPELGTIAFRPGPGKEITQFGAGQHQVTVRWRALLAAPDQVDGEYTWAFGVA